MLLCWLTYLKNRLNEESGQGLVEYALIIVLLAIAFIAIVELIGGREVLRGFFGPTPTPTP